MSPMEQLSRLKRESAAATVYSIFREAVLDGSLAPGARLDLPALERQLGVSRSPLKDALRRLEQDGLIQILPQRGTFVASPSDAELREAFEVRLALELHAIRLFLAAASDDQLMALADMVKRLQAMLDSGEAIEQYQKYVDLDHQFHETLVRAAGNERLLKAHERENVHFQMARIRYGHAEEGLEQVQEEHERFITALLARDEAEAEQSLISHLRRACESLLKDIAAQRAAPSAQHFASIRAGPKDSRTGPKATNEEMLVKVGPKLG